MLLVSLVLAGGELMDVIEHVVVEEKRLFKPERKARINGGRHGNQHAGFALILDVVRVVCVLFIGAPFDERNSTTKDQESGSEKRADDCGMLQTI